MSRLLALDEPFTDDPFLSDVAQAADNSYLQALEEDGFGSRAEREALNWWESGRVIARAGHRADERSTGIITTDPKLPVGCRLANHARQAAA